MLAWHLGTDRLAAQYTNLLLNLTVLALVILNGNPSILHTLRHLRPNLLPNPLQLPQLNPQLIHHTRQLMRRPLHILHVLIHLTQPLPAGLNSLIAVNTCLYAHLDFVLGGLKQFDNLRVDGLVTLKFAEQDLDVQLDGCEAVVDPGCLVEGRETGEEAGGGLCELDRDGFVDGCGRGWGSDWSWWLAAAANAETAWYVVHVVEMWLK